MLFSCCTIAATCMKRRGKYSFSFNFPAKKANKHDKKAAKKQAKIVANQLHAGKKAPKKKKSKDGKPGNQIKPSNGNQMAPPKVEQMKDSMQEDDGSE